MAQKEKSRPSKLKWIALAIVLIAGGFAYNYVLGRPSFDPVRIGQAETRMWQAYYSGNKIILGLETIALLRSECGLTLMESKQIGELLARSAMNFHVARGDYEKVALPDLIEAYRLIKQATSATFDYEAAARADLDWWIARRTPGQNSVEQVGEGIAKLYAILYGGEVSNYLEAGTLRAEAAALRDNGGRNANWPRIEELLIESFKDLQVRKQLRTDQ